MQFTPLFQLDRWTIAPFVSIVPPSGFDRKWSILKKPESVPVNVAGSSDFRCHKTVHQSRLVSRTVNSKPGAQEIMTLTKYVGILASGLALTGAASAQGTDAMSEIAQLKAEVATLKSQNGDKWLTEERAAEIKSLVKDVLADSETRTSLQGSGATSGYNNGFFISSADGNFKLNLSLLTQARFTWNYQPGENIGTPSLGRNLFGNVYAQVEGTGTVSGTGDGVSTWAFENRRTQMAFAGNIVDPSWTYMTRLNYGSAIDPYTPEAGALVLQDAWVNKDFGNGVGLKVGQFKSPFMAESLRNDGAQLTAERSVVDYIFSGGYTQGIMLNYTQDMFRAMGSYNNGPRAQNGTWSTGSNNSISLSGRAEFKAMGSWAQFDNETSLKSDESGLVIGAAIQYYNNRGTSVEGQYNPSVASIIYGDTTGLTTTGAVDWTADATFKSGGMNLSAAFVGSNASYANNGTASNESFSSYGMVVQGGYRFTDSLEAFGRWEWMNIENGAATPGGLPASATDVNNILTFGVNVYAGTNMKWTTQFGISLSDIGSTTADLGGAGWNPDANTSNNDQMNVISQLQIMF